MTTTLKQDEIIEMAKEAGISIRSDWAEQELEAFAKLVADVATAKEREACAKVCDELAELNRFSETDSMWEWSECSAAIRARGEA